MSPRKYEMKKRGAAVEETRRRIVRATLDLHAEQGVEQTSWDDIAARAGVGVGTVYRHFPSMDELLPACGQLTFSKLKLPDPADLEGTRSGAARVRKMVEELCALYERGENELRNIREERDLHPVMREAHDQVEAGLDRFVRAAIGSKNLSVVRAMTDVRVWASLKDRGVTGRAAIKAMEQAVASVISS